MLLALPADPQMLILGLICMVAGVLLIVLEMFIPGFGVPGILGTVLCVAGIFLSADNLISGLLLFLGLLFILLICGAVIMRSAKGGRLARSRLVLQNTLDTAHGYVSNEDLSGLVGVTGVAHTLLRPAGIGNFSSGRIDVVTDGEFLPAGTPITVIAVEGRRVIVRQADPATESFSDSLLQK